MFFCNFIPMRNFLGSKQLKLSVGEHFSASFTKCAKPFNKTLSLVEHFKTSLVNEWKVMQELAD